MTGGAVIRAASAGAARRLVPSAVVFGVLAASTAAALLGLTLLTSGNQGFYAGCAATRCAHLAVTINSAKVTAGQLASTRHLPGVTQAAGPYPQATITITTSATARQQSGHGPSTGSPAEHQAGGLAKQQVTVVGRASPNGPLQHVVANPSIMGGGSRWPAHRGEISLDVRDGIRVPVGSTFTVTSAPGKPTLTLVGYSQQQVSYNGGWVVPGEIAALRAQGALAQQQMLYTFTHAATQAQIDADLAELKAALPRGAIVGSHSWLGGVQNSQRQSSANTPFVVAFAVLALVLAVLIVANVVSAAVIAAYRRIGVLKSIGFTPAQVASTYLAQIGLPALAGAVAGTVLGNWWVLPVIGKYPIAGEHVSVPLWVNITTTLGMCALTGLAAAVPALRAGRLPAAQATAAGQAPRAGRGYGPHRLAGRLALPRPVTIGLAAPFSRPARSAVTLAALTFGLAGVVLGISLYSSIHKINYSSLDGLGQLQAGYHGGRRYALTPSQNATIKAALRAQPGTLHYVAESDVIPAAFTPGTASHPGQAAPVAVGVAGRPGLDVLTYAYDGDSIWLGWNMITGRWYHGSHEVDVNSVLLAAAHLKVGGTLTLTVNHKPVTARIAGEVFNPSGLPTVYTSWQALGGPSVGLAVSHYDIALTPGTSPSAYTSALTRALGSGYIVYPPAGASIANINVTSLFRLLAALVAALAALGVLNSVLMATRERVHDLGIYKSVGMAPRQTIAMVISWIIVPALIAALIALPAGLITQDLLVRHLAADAGMTLPASFVHVLSPADLTLLTLAGLGIATAGSLGPATWAATSKTTTALHAE